ncbi:alpha/beta hydrolase-fold protein [Fontivita pretiosa]|uniref:alpha/beta hydrolase-fold protein n=1 Tax=Fontivita pretiosa TaxID=2989684 RepID=UPI003D17E075
MKRALLVVFVLFFLVAVAIAGWYAVHTRQIEAELQRYKAWGGARRPVKVTFEVQPCPGTPEDQPLWISGNAPEMGGWDGAGVALTRGQDGKYRGTIEVLSGIEYSYKVTRGSWSTVERGPQGQEIPNRTLMVEQDATIPITIATWVDGGKSIPGLHTLSGTIREHRKFRSELLNNERTIMVYLPPGYDQSPDIRYPVLYMHDGQNLFDAATSFAGIEWKVDEAAQELIGEGRIEPLIIVGIYNSEQRTAEFTPPQPHSTAGGESERGLLYARFVIEEVKPFIDKTYRTRPDRKNTALAGSSMGGMITLYIAKTFPGVFGQVAVLTPHLRVGQRDIVQELSAGDTQWIKGMRLWIDMGDRGEGNYPGTDPMGDARALVQVLQGAGLRTGIDYQYTEIPGGEHNESAWQARIDQVLLFLFAKPAEQPAAAGAG